jgi:mRNA interferase RelE/StbE
MPRERRLRVPDEIVAVIRELHPDLRRKLRAALEDIVRDPSIGDPLREELAGLIRLRVGQLRIVYRITSRSIEIVAIGPRATIYRDLTVRRSLRRR